jgi:hypothetical protein
MESRLKTLTPSSSSRLRTAIVRLLLACGGLSLLLMGARGQSGALGHGEVMDGVFSCASAMVSNVAHAGSLNEQPPIIVAARSAAADNSVESEDDDDDGRDDVHVKRTAHFRATRSLKCKRISAIAPASSRDFANLPLRAPPV